MGQPLVSVVLPTYNRANTISRSIDSVLNQTYSNLELIVVDDGSSDNTDAIISEYVLTDSRVNYVKQEHLGANRARNLGIKLARGQYIAFQDSDDIWFNNKLEKLMNISEWQDEAYAGVFSAFYKCDQNDSKYIIPKDKIELLSWEEQFKLLLVNNFIGTPSMILKKEAIEDVGGFSVNLPRFQDWEFCIRIGIKYKLYYYPEPLFIAYESLNSISKNKEAGIEALEFILSNFYDLISQDRKVLSFHHYRLGSNYFWLGKKLRAINNFYKAILNNPLCIMTLSKAAFRFLVKNKKN